MGTPAYMSPEQARGEPADARSDIFSFGRVLYEMISGECAFPGKTPAEMFAAILKDEPREIGETGKTVPPELERIIRHYLEKKPEERFQSARDLAFDLRSVATGSGEPARYPAEATKRPRAKRWVAAVALVMVAAVALLVVLNPGGWRERLFRRAMPTPSEGMAHSAITSLVVLPLENLSGDPEQEYFVDGMTDALIANLGQISALRVISRTSAMHFKRTNKSIPEIAHQLAVDAAVEGSVVRAGERVRITAQLIHGATDSRFATC